jgi:predicted nucleic acid-binding protein
MPAVFADTAALYGILNSRDELNSICVDVLRYLINTNWTLITHRWVEYETLSKLKKNGMKFCDAYNDLKNELSIGVLEIDSRVERNALQMFWTYRDKTWSVIDCFSFTIMSERALQYAFTSDHHFAEAGFFPLMEIADGRPHRTFKELL